MKRLHALRILSAPALMGAMTCLLAVGWKSGEAPPAQQQHPNRVRRSETSLQQADQGCHSRIVHKRI